MVYKTYKVRRNSFGNYFSAFSLTSKLIIFNILFYIGVLFVLSIYGADFLLNNFALTPSLFLSGKSLWTLLTSMFTHVYFLHLFFNMFSLFFIGNFLERIIGSRRFFWLYLFSGLIGGIFFVLSGFIFKTNIPGVGASGALFGILGVLAMLVPYSKIYLIAGPLLVIIAEVLLSDFFPSAVSFITAFANILIILMIMAIFSFSSSFRKIAIPLELPMWLLPFIAIVPLVIVGFFVDLPIGNSAHIGGLMVGLLYGFYLKNKYPRKTMMIRRYFS